MFDEWNLDDTDFMKELDNMFSLKSLLKTVWKWIKNVGVYWIPVIGLVISLIDDCPIYIIDRINRSTFIVWLFYQILTLVLLISLI